MPTGSEFTILWGPEIDATGIPIVIVSSQSQGDDVAVMERYILLPKSDKPLIIEKYSISGISVLDNKDPVKYLVNSNEERMFARAFLLSYIFTKLSLEQRLITPEIYHYELKELDRSKVENNLYLCGNYKDQLEKVRDDTQCSALKEFLRNLTG